MKKIICIAAVIAIALGTGGVLAWQWQSSLTASAYDSPLKHATTNDAKNVKSHMTHAAAPSSQTEAATQPAVSQTQAPSQAYNCGVSGCNQTTSHRHASHHDENNHGHEAEHGENHY